MPDLSTRREAAVIEIGSSSTRMAVAQREPDGQWRHIDDLDLPTGLGHDSFADETIAPATTERCVTAIRRFQQVLRELGIGPSDTRVVATSAVREARNQDTFTNRLLIATGLPVQVLTESEVSRLTYLAVHPILKKEAFFRSGNTLVVEVGGGSTEILAFAEGRVKTSVVNRLGSLRMQRELGDYARGEHAMAAFAEYLTFPVAQMVSGLRIEGATQMVVLGSEARLVRDTLPNAAASAAKLTSIEVDAIRGFLKTHLTWLVADITREYGLSEHQAETLLPALAVYVALAKALGESQILVSSVSLRDGVLAEMFAGQVWEREFRRQTLHSAGELARKYRVDRKHAESVATVAQQLLAFVSQTVQFDPRDETLLHVAALLHEVGMFINSRSYHKHSLYLIANSEIFGLDSVETSLVACIARYHRRAAPQPTHEEFVNLLTADRIRVSKLAAILRVADAMEFSHERGQEALTFEIQHDVLAIRVRTHEDLTLAQRQLDARAGMFQAVYGLRVVLQSNLID